MSETTSEYSEAELASIRRAIAPPPPPPPAEILAVASSPLPQWMRPFWKLVDLEPELFRRLSADPWVQALSLYAFFPRSSGGAAKADPSRSSARPHAPAAGGHPALWE